MPDINRNKYWNLLLSIFIVFGNILMDHFYAPSGITLTPIIIIIVACLISLNKGKFDTVIQVIIIYFLIALNDLGIKLYGGGMHDSEGLGFIHLFLLAGLIPCFMILALSTFKNKNDSLLKSLLSLFLVFALIWIHFYFFSNTGLGKYYKIYHSFLWN